MKWRLAKNAFSNLCRGAAAAVTAMVLPPVLIRHMASSSYAVWVLALQAAAYLGYLDFGLQTAVGRYVAFAEEKNDPTVRDAIFSTALAGLSLASCLGILVVIVLAFTCHYIFPAVPAPLLTSLRFTMIIVGFSVALGLPASAWSGVSVGIQKYEIPAIAIGSGKLLAAAGLIIAVLTGQSLLTMAWILAGANLYGYVLQFALVRRVASHIRFRLKLISQSIIRELFSYCLSLTVWSLSMLLVGGFDVLLVGRFQFGAVAPYAASITLITFLAGIQTSIFGVIMPHAAALHAREDPEALGHLLVRTTRLGVLLLFVTGLPLIFFSRPIIGLWIGWQFALVGGRVLAVLVLANMVRLAWVPYSTLLVSTGQQRAVIVSPLLEGITNVTASILLGIEYGAIGIAAATLVGAIIAVSANLFYNMPRTAKCITVSRLRLIREAFLIPSACAAPVLLSLFTREQSGVTANQIARAALFLSVGACAVLLLRSIPGSARISFQRDKGRTL